MIYERIIQLFKENNVRYNEKIHEDDGHGASVAKIHGLPEHCGCKAIVVKLKRPDRYCLVVLSFTRKLDMKSLTNLMDAKKASFADAETSNELTSCISGAIPPFSFNESLPVIIDESIKEIDTLFFNVGRLDRSVSIKTQDYLALMTKAQVAAISQ